jgi:hypothetical protein
MGSSSARKILYSLILERKETYFETLLLTLLALLDPEEEGVMMIRNISNY